MTNVHVTGYRNEVTSSVGSFLANLPEMLGAMKDDPRCLVAVIEFEDGRYVQFWATSEGEVIGEVVSNLNIGAAIALTRDDEDELRARGWLEPAPGPRPNWRYEAKDDVELLALVSMTHDAVVHVLGETLRRRVTVRTWAMGAPHDRTMDDLLYESRVYYQEALLEIEGRLRRA